ncbi:MAG TPA: hypothetical protein VFE51_27615 [Verrucomicrobiae bacterium]|nr:hypothetical protein [Verrucomicrobiae bacterium]
MKHLVFPSVFWLRVILFAAASLVFLLVVGALFENASGADFEPLRAGRLFAAYHGLLATLLGVVSLPALIIYPILTHFGVDPNRGDSFYLGVICIVDGLFLAVLLQVILYFRSRRQLSHDGHPTI